MRTLRITAALLFLSASMLPAQKMGGGAAGGGHVGGGGAHFNGGHASGGNGSRGTFNNGFRRRGGYPGYGYGYYWPVYGGYWDSSWDFNDFNSDEQPPYQQQSNASTPVVIMQNSAPQAAYRPGVSPKLQDVPQDGPATAAKNSPPALFVLSSGERIETDRYLLSATSVNVDVNRQQRTIPLSDVNIDATLAANHQRGLDLNIPHDSSSIVLGF